MSRPLMWIETDQRIRHGAITQPAPTRRLYGWLALGYLALVWYGSLVPFQYEALPLEETLDRFRALPHFALGLGSRSDWVANVLLFVPLTFLVMAALCADRPGMGLITAPLVIAAAAALSFGIEFVQLYFPARTTSLNDVVAESLGGALGVLMWLLTGQRITRWLRRLGTAMESCGLAALLLPAYLALLLLVHLMPLDLTISPVELYHKYREGRVRLRPFAGWDADLFQAMQDTAWTMAYFLIGGVLLAHLRSPVWARWRSWPLVLGVGLALAGLMEFAQLFVYTRCFDTSDIVLSGPAFLTGWAAGRAWKRKRVNERAIEGERTNGEPAGALRFPRSRAPVLARATLLAAWLGLAVFAAWRPFDFRWDPQVAAEKLRGLPLIPLADYYQRSEFSAFDQLLHQTLLFVPLGALMAPADRGTAPGWTGLIVVLTAVALAAGLAAGQLLLPSRYPSVTDVLVEGLGAGIGFLAMSRLRLARAVAGS